MVKQLSVSQKDAELKRLGAVVDELLHLCAE